MMDGISLFPAFFFPFRDGSFVNTICVVSIHLRPHRADMGYKESVGSPCRLIRSKMVFQHLFTTRQIAHDKIE